MLPDLPTNHPYIKLILSDHLDWKVVPTLDQLKAHLEESWSHGFDPQGARHFDNRIRDRTGRSSWIGAVEVSSLLSYLHVDSTVIQFIQCQESRALLGNFVWSYFSKKAGYDGCWFCSQVPSNDQKRSRPAQATKTTRYLHSTACAAELLQFASVVNDVEVEVECCKCPLLPLYLQWEGHSVTIVGIQKNDVTPTSSVLARGDEFSTARAMDFSLLVFDPLKSGIFLKNMLTGLQPKLSCPHALTGAASLAPIRLSTSDLVRLDCQIVMSTHKPLTSSERQKRRVKVNALTAAVTSSLCSNL